MAQSHTYVLVHGAWAGGWIWRDMADRLRALGHRVYTPTLTGLGERSHLVSPQINLTTHALDVANLIKWEELSDIVLVGHSYGGMVISGVAEKVPAGAIRSIVYLDAFLPNDGQSLADLAAPPGEAQPVPLQLNPVPFPGMGRTGDPHLEKLVTPHPLGCFTEKLVLTGARERIPIKTYVQATGQMPGGPPVSPFTRMAETVASNPAWRLEKLACGHNTMIDLPQETLDVFLRAAD
jgi:pimeloyl-ACP methyl ester carboxylesterase